MTAVELAGALRRRVSRDPVARAVREAAEDLDAEVWLVGGSVRDVALGRRPGDLDLVGGRGTLRLVRELARRWGHRAFRFRKRGITTWRLNAGGHQVDLVDASRRGLLRDLERRELTINAIAFDPRQARLSDPLRGLRDLRRGLLRLPRAGVLGEDPLRVLRLARFLAELPLFRLHAEARREARAAAPRLGRAAVERVRDELNKLLAAEAPGRGLRALAALGGLDPLLPELLPLRSCVAGGGRPDVWTHTVDAVERSARSRGLPGAGRLDPSGRRLLRWTLLLHDIAKPATFELRDDGRPTFHGHESLGAQRADALLRRLRLPRAERRRITALVLHHLRPSQLAEAGRPVRGLRRLIRDAGDDLPLLVVHAACDAHASGAPDAATRWPRLRRALLELLRLHDAAQARPAAPLIGGRDLIATLDLAPGPEIGRLLGAVREAQAEGRLADREAALALARRLHRGGKAG